MKYNVDDFEKIMRAISPDLECRIEYHPFSGGVHRGFSIEIHNKKTGIKLIWPYPDSMQIDRVGDRDENCPFNKNGGEITIVRKDTEE